MSRHKKVLTMTNKPEPKRKQGRPAGRIQNTQLQMRASPEFIRAIDEWREEQPDQPPRSVAVRRLIERGLKRR
jgi:hypothetical protein